MRDKSKSADLLKAFRETRNQVQKSCDLERNQKSPYKRGYSKKKSSTAKSISFEEKYSNLGDTIDTFTTSDLMYFFQKKAEEVGIKYVIANHARDCAIFKKLLKSYSQREICLMIEFMFTSNQDYLDKTSIQPTILASTYCNTIYRDSMLWVEDKYFPAKKHSKTTKREWDKESQTDSAKIGEWE